MLFAHSTTTAIVCHSLLRRVSLRYLFVLTRLFSTNDNVSDAGSPIKPNGNYSRNKLVKQIQARILTGGPITVADYMREVLTNPSGGYYMSRDVFGSQGDFVTSPEISQMFGELIAVWFLNEWIKCGRPKPLQITELGPGRGTLISDILRVFSKFKLLESGDLSVSLVEVSPHLTRIQEKKICGKMTDPVEGKHQETAQPGADHHYKESISLQYGCRVRWYHRLTDVARSFTFFLAHEFFDALPIHKLVKTEKGWREVLVDLDPAQAGRFRYVLSRERTPACLYRHEQESKSECEVSPQSLVIAQEMASRIHQNGGIGLIVDYGHEGDKTDTFRAFRDHKLHNPLVDPGTADLTADVDFSALKRAVCRPPQTEDDWKPLLTFGTVNQADFLNKMGIQVRLEQLLATVKGDAAAAQLESAHQMLTDPDGMGGKFKILALFPGVMEQILKRYPPYGFV